MSTVAAATRVKDWMSRPVATIHADDLAHAAAMLMKARKLRHLPVVDREGRLLGIVTDRDLRQVMFRGVIQARLGVLRTTLATLPVRDIMTWSVVTVRPDTEIRDAARLMHERKIGALPVVQEGKVVGMLTESDALQALERLLALTPPTGFRRTRTLHAPPVLGPRDKPSVVRPLQKRPAGSAAYDFGFPIAASPEADDAGQGD
jgi:CBS-domain-containing membrane protein